MVVSARTQIIQSNQEIMPFYSLNLFEVEFYFREGDSLAPKVCLKEDKFVTIKS